LTEAMQYQEKLIPLCFYENLTC